MVRAYFPQKSVQSIISNTDNPAQGITPSFATLFLDLFPGAQAAYSLRKLKGSYTGDAIRVKRSSDSTELDIGFTSEGNLDEIALLAFTGVGPTDDGDVIIWYDQSGNGLDLDETLDLPPVPPKIVIDGVLQTVNGLSTLNFTPDAILHSILSLPSPASSIFCFNIMQVFDTPIDPINWNLNNPNEGAGEVSTRMFSSSGQIVWNAGNTSTEQLVTAESLNNENQHILTLIKTAGTDNQQIRLDENELVTKTQVSSSTTLSKIIFGNSKDDASNGTNMNFSEFILYTDNQFANLSAIEQDMLSYWKFNALITASGDELITASGDILVAV